MAGLNDKQFISGGRSKKKKEQLGSFYQRQLAESHASEMLPG
jgi:hypothetical protein